MWRGSIAVLLVWLLATPTHVARARPSPQEKQATIQEKVVEIPVGSVVEVRLKTKEKIRGQLGATTSEGFSVKSAKGGTVEERKIAFGDVKSIKMVEKGMSTTAKITLGALAGVGAVFLILLAVFAAGGGGS